MVTQRQGAFRRRTRGIGVELSEAAVEVLIRGATDRDLDDAQTFWGLLVDCDTEIESAWRAVGPRLLAAYIVKFPGRRPAAWWHFDAPEPLRKRLSGAGEIVPRHTTAESLFCHTAFGLPLGYRRGTIDPDRPPVHESQASYLKRHGLLSASEAKRLSPEDFEGEVYDVGAD